ncbi:helix-turn-helix domain-containing protein [Streptacidiphilus sp. MAP5-3]|uniref:helix-turn-helix domain-containing protein n=1 Tax=unclassified Streptacidiphilus TaxID=2643834 RepID=UPI00351861E3
MTSGTDPTELSVSDAVALRIKESRARRGWSAKQLAERCAERGLVRLTHSVLNNIESGRHNENGQRKRDVTVDELLGLALVLDVAPIHLLALPENGETEVAVRVAPDVVLKDNAGLLQWVRGDAPLPESDARLYYASAIERLPSPDVQRTSAEFARSVLQDRAKELLRGFNEQTAQMAANATAQLQDLVAEAEQAINDGASLDEVLALLKQAGQE